MGNKLYMETKKINGIISKLGILLLIAIIGIFNIIIGENGKGLRVLPISVLMGLIILYLIILKIINRKQSIFFKGKVDYFVLIFMFATTLPLIFGTFASYSDAVEFVMKYFFIYSVYILARNVIKEKKDLGCIIVTVLISSVIQVLLYFDYIHAQMFKDFMKWLDLIYTKGSEFSGIFGYANAQAIYMALCIFLAMYRFNMNKNKILKTIDIIYILFALYIIYIAEARAVLLVVGLTLFILFVIKFRKQIIKNKIKILVGVFAFIILVIMFLSMALKVSKEVVAENKTVNENIRYSFKQNQKYTVELELETIYTGERSEYKDSSFTIKIYDIGKYFANQKLYSETIGEINGRYKFEFTPTKDTNCIKVKISNNDKGTIVLNNCYINGEKHIINYKYLPNDLAAMLSGYKVRGKSIPQRLYMYKDCLKMAKDSPFVGHGGNAWKNISLAYAEYKGALRESHSYFFEILISYGILGLIAYLTLIIYFFINIFKKCKKDKEVRKNKLFIAIGLLLVVLHSMVDFDMSFMLIQIMVYICISMLLYDEQEIENTSPNKKSILDYGIIIFLAFILSLYIRADISQYLVSTNNEKHQVTPYVKKYYSEMINDDIRQNKDVTYVLDEIQDFMRKEPFYAQNDYYDKYFKLIYKNINYLTDEQLKKYIEFGIDRIKNVNEKSPMYINEVIKRTSVFAKIINNFEMCIKEKQDNLNGIDKRNEILNNAIIELKSIINSEYDTNISNLEDIEKSDYDENDRNSFKEKYQKVVENIK